MQYPKKGSIASWFRDFLIKNKIDNIITTNYDHGIEYILKKCGYKNDKNNSSEKIYNTKNLLILKRRRLYYGKYMEI